MNSKTSLQRMHCPIKTVNNLIYTGLIPLMYCLITENPLMAVITIETFYSVTKHH